MRAITIEFEEGKGFNVRECELSTGGLCWDEMLGTIAELTHPKIPSARYAMRTDAEWKVYYESMKIFQRFI